MVSLVSFICFAEPWSLQDLYQEVNFLQYKAMQNVANMQDDLIQVYIATTRKTVHDSTT